MGTPLLDASLTDPLSERVRASHSRAIKELQTSPAAAMRVIQGVTLKDGVTTPIAHKLGRAPVWHGTSHVRASSSGVTLTAGVIQEVNDSAYDPAKFLTIVASGFGADVVVNVAVL